MVVAPGQSMRVLSWNILHGQVIPPANQVDQLASLKSATAQVVSNYQPDFICLQEVDYQQPRSDFLNQTKIIAKSSGLKYWAWSNPLLLLKMNQSIPLRVMELVLLQINLLKNFMLKNLENQ
ncbi:MAG: hypothetical protein RIS16_672 [Actinomycetota bacterium]